MDQQRQGKDGLTFRSAAIAASALLATGWGSLALAAASSVVECDDVAKNLQSLEVAVDELSVESIEHIPADIDITASEPLEARPERSVVTSPILDLTPRVAAIIRDVFGQPESPDGNVEEIQLLENSGVQIGEPGKAQASSPLAGSANGVELPRSDDTEIEPDRSADGDSVPQISRMYRTDI